MILEVNEGFIWKIIFIELLYLYMVDIICIYYIELLSTYVYIYMVDIISLIIMLFGQLSLDSQDSQV